jgi:hypothetical protein
MRRDATPVSFPDANRGLKPHGYHHKVAPRPWAEVFAVAIGLEEAVAARPWRYFFQMDFSSWTSNDVSVAVPPTVKALTDATAPRLPRFSVV